MRIKHPRSQSDCSTMVDILRTCADFQPDSIAYHFIHEKNKIPESITYRKLDENARSIAALLQRNKVKMGDRVILLYGPSLDLISAFFGCLYAGAIAVLVYPPINTKFVEKLQAIIKNSNAKVLLTTHETFKLLRFAKLLKFFHRLPLCNYIIRTYFAKQIELSQWDLEKLKWFTTDTIDHRLSEYWQRLNIPENHLAFLQYTSGSTGSPKGVMISHHNLLHNLSITRDAFGVNDQSIIVSWLPPYHDMGLIGGILQPLFSGVPCILMSPFHFLHKPLEWLKAISDYKATISGGPNFAYNYCVEKISERQKEGLDLSSWKVAFNGAEPVHGETLESFSQAFLRCKFTKKSFHPCFGLAEATLLVSVNPSSQTLFVSDKALSKHQVKIVAENDIDAKPLICVGPMLQEVKIVDPTHRRFCKTGEVGEIWIHGASVAQGYWHLSRETQATFHVYIDDDEEHKPYLRTGDLGFIYENRLYIAGRLQDLIIIHGINHYPQDIEHTVNNAHPLIRPGQCAAFCIEDNKTEKLAIVCEVQASASNNDYEKIIHDIRNEVSKKNRLATHIIALIPPKTIPKTTSGKIRRQHIRELLISNHLSTLVKKTLHQ